MDNSKRDKENSNKEILDAKKASKEKDKSAEQSNAPDQPLSDMNE